MSVEKVNLTKLYVWAKYQIDLRRWIQSVVVAIRKRFHRVPLHDTEKRNSAAHHDRFSSLLNKVREGRLELAWATCIHKHEANSTSTRGCLQLSRFALGKNGVGRAARAKSGNRVIAGRLWRIASSASFRTFALISGDDSMTTASAPPCFAELKAPSRSDGVRTSIVSSVTLDSLAAASIAFF
jgi:hypothetical protein